jgi:hypothetical protein
MFAFLRNMSGRLKTCSKALQYKYPAEPAAICIYIYAVNSKI